jgi:transposase
MLVIGCDFHTRFQQIAMVDTETGELIQRRLEHRNGEAKNFYAELQKPVRVGMEAAGYAQWFERMLAKLGHELWVGDAAEIRAAMGNEAKRSSLELRSLSMRVTACVHEKVRSPHVRPSTRPAGN